MTEKIRLPNGQQIPGDGKEDELSTPPPLPKSVYSRSKLEKLLFEALEAHSEGKYKTAIQIYSQVLHQKLKSRVMKRIS